jgi:hypothetical protein
MCHDQKWVPRLKGQTGMRMDCVNVMVNESTLGGIVATTPSHECGGQHRTKRKPNEKPKETAFKIMAKLDGVTKDGIYSPFPLRLI